jgi:hypothetical protein
MVTKNIVGCHKDWQLDLFLPILWQAKKVSVTNLVVTQKYSIATRKNNLVTNLVSTKKGFGHHLMIGPFQMVTKIHFGSPFIK